MGSPALIGEFLVAYGSVTSLLEILWSSCPSQQGDCQGLARGSLLQMTAAGVILVMAAKRQKLRENIIEFSLFTVAAYVCPNKEGTSRMQNRNTLGLFPLPKLHFTAREGRRNKWL